MGEIPIPECGAGQVLPQDAGRGHEPRRSHTRLGAYRPAPGALPARPGGIRHRSEPPRIAVNEFGVTPNGHLWATRLPTVRQACAPSPKGKSITQRSRGSARGLGTRVRKHQTGEHESPHENREEREQRGNWRRGGLGRAANWCDHESGGPRRTRAAFGAAYTSSPPALSAARLGPDLGQGFRAEPVRASYAPGPRGRGDLPAGTRE